MSLRSVFIGIAAIGLGLYVGIFILPYHFSGQKPINESGLTGYYSPDEKIGEYLGKKFTSVYYPPSLAYNKNVLGVSTENKRIEVDLTNQKLYAFEGTNKIFEFPVSTGLWGKTPTGEFRVWIKLRYTRMVGGNQALGTYYNLPNVPYTMFFYNDEIPKSRGYGIHGTYWHNNFGHPMSHGCVNVKTENMALLYDWAGPDTSGKPSTLATPENPGTRIIIYGVAPNN
jgi:lipoprotein-anchoring transpeptidase ErfK/SrfK